MHCALLASLLTLHAQACHLMRDRWLSKKREKKHDAHTDTAVAMAAPDTSKHQVFLESPLQHAIAHEIYLY